MTKSEAVSHFGSVKQLAEALNISTQAISQWPKEVPFLRAIQLEKISDGVLKANSSIPVKQTA